MIPDFFQMNHASSGIVPQTSPSPPATTAILPSEASVPLNHVTKESYQELLAEYIGRFVVCRFLIGSTRIETMAGLLQNVGPNYLTLFDPCTKIQTICDLYSLKYFSVYERGTPEDEKRYCEYRMFTSHHFPVV